MRVVARTETRAPALVDARSVAGRLVLVAAFTAVLAAAEVSLWWQMGLVLALTSVLPEHRKRVLALAAFGWVYLNPPLNTGLLEELAPGRDAARWVGAGPNAVVVGGVWLFAWVYLYLVRRFPESPPGRRPVLGLVACLVALLAAAQAPLTGVLWFVVAASAMVLGKYIWFFAYWVSDNAGGRLKSHPLSQVGYWRPFWGFSNVPFGKGAAYLERVEARNDEQLAAVQLKGLKLLLWATVLNLGLRALNDLLYGPYEGSLFHAPSWVPYGLIPTYEMALDRQLQGDPYPWSLRWLALIAYFGLRLLRLGVVGHTIIATARMAGFDVFRNTYRPLSAPSIAEFYNRTYYYFKELLVAFFFYPAYLRYFKRYPRLRLFVATLMAAGLGNFLFHFLRDDENIFRRGLWGGLVAYQPYALYALILGTAIGLSQLRLKKKDQRRNDPPRWRKVLAVAGVLTFYCLLGVFDQPTIFPDEGNPRTIALYADYFVSLFRP
jgi:hypothetical protein